MNFYVELIKGRLTQRWRWRARGRNHEILCTSEHYANRVDALAAIETLFGTQVEIKGR